ncbi:MAG: DUF420 domain-containing protein [Lacipirellulaceae bacterium]
MSSEVFNLLAAHPLVHLNAGLNSFATILIVVGYLQIRQGKRDSHGRTMLAAFLVSVLFLISYLIYHSISGHVKFQQTGALLYTYWSILGSHIILAIVCAVAVPITVLRGLKALGWGVGKELSDEQRQAVLIKHRSMARWLLPVWLYVSVTGVIVYLMLYHIWPNQPA